MTLLIGAAIACLSSVPPMSRQATTTVQPSQAHPQVLKELTQLEVDLQTAAHKGDAAFFENLMTEDFFNSPNWKGANQGTGRIVASENGRSIRGIIGSRTAS